MEINTNYSNESPKRVRELIRNGTQFNTTAGICDGYAQANLAILPKNIAYDFLLFAQRNPKPCPILEVSDVGSATFPLTAKDSDIRTDVPKYRIYVKGELQGEYKDITEFWREDFVTFSLGCSLSFESALMEDGIEIRHITENKKVPMYISNIECNPAGIFHGPMVVSMRPMTYKEAIRAVQITSRFPNVHGAPVHIGNPNAIGIKDINSPDFGDSVEIKQNEIPVFWACGVTPQAVAMKVKPEIMITHAPGLMLITDVKNQRLAVL